MILRPLTQDDRVVADQVAPHPLQSWSWGEFREKTGVEVERLGRFDDLGKLTQVHQVTFHTIPLLGGSAGYLPKGEVPTEETFIALRDLGKKHNAVFIKLEPGLQFPANQNEVYKDTDLFLKSQGCVYGKTLFTPYTFVLDLTPSEEQLFENCKQKTRYNIRLAKKKGVEVVEDTSEAGLQEYLRLLEETTTRQNFYAHDRKYFETMWQVMKDNPMFHIFTARYQGKVITAWIVFLFNGVGYYPYGASSRDHKDVMANNLMMWEVLMYAKQQGCHSFDMWGALGPEAESSHKWYGFHRFKEGYSGVLMQSLGTYDFVLNAPLYSLFTIGDKIRWAYLRFRSRFV